MTMSEMVSLTGIPQSEIERYSRGGLIGREERGNISFGGDDAKKLGLIRRLAEIKSKEDELNVIISQYDEIIDSIPEEDRGIFLNDNNTAFVPKEVAKAVRPFTKGKNKPDAGSIEEVLIKVYALIVKEKSLRKEIKVMRVELHNQTKDYIENMSEDEAFCALKTKWIAPIVESILLLPDSIVNWLEGKINALIEKYSVTMLDIDAELMQSEQEFCALIEELEGDEYDMLGLKELQKLLGGSKND